MNRIWAVVMAGLCGGVAAAQILAIADLNTSQIRAMDRNKTALLIPGGILEEHGPYLPSYTDGYAGEAFTQELPHAIVRRPGWTVLVFPQIPLGNGGANNIGAKWAFPGTYTVRMSTLRAVYMDLGSELGEQGFRWIFLIHNHGDPNHNRALDEASDYFHDVYGGTMVHLFGLRPIMECCGATGSLLTKEGLAEDGFTVHAGADEHSQMLFLRPDLVAPGYHNAPSVTGGSFEDLYRLAAVENWLGYFGAPHLASAAMGARAFQLQAEKLIAITGQILDGLDYRKIPRFADNLDPRDAIGVKASLDQERKRERAENQWLRSRGSRQATSVIQRERIRR